MSVQGSSACCAKPGAATARHNTTRAAPQAGVRQPSNMGLSYHRYTGGMPTAAWWVPPRTTDPELIDLPDTPWEDVLKGMRDVQRINQLLFTYDLLLDALMRHVRWPEDRP